MINWLRRRLGLIEIEKKLNGQSEQLSKILSYLGHGRSQLTVTNLAIGRIVAKLDPMYAIDEMNPERRAESDKIAEQVLRKMAGEHKASNPYGDK